MRAMISQIIVNNNHVHKDISRFSMGIVSYQGLIYIVGGCTHSRRHMQVQLTINKAAIMMILDVMMMIVVVIIMVGSHRSWCRITR